MGTEVVGEHYAYLGKRQVQAIQFSIRITGYHIPVTAARTCPTASRQGVTTQLAHGNPIFKPE
jgi:hypothetical protein